tara:strand:- start:257 stop:487 length:231 start_codon:yes stop_codon:yes gene_type:complete
MPKSAKLNKLNDQLSNAIDAVEEAQAAYKSADNIYAHLHPEDAADKRERASELKIAEKNLKKIEDLISSLPKLNQK